MEFPVSALRYIGIQLHDTFTRLTEPFAPFQDGRFSDMNILIEMIVHPTEYNRTRIGSFVDSGNLKIQYEIIRGDT